MTIPTLITTCVDSIKRRCQVIRMQYAPTICIFLIRINSQDIQHFQMNLNTQIFQRPIGKEMAYLFLLKGKF